MGKEDILKEAKKFGLKGVDFEEYVENIIKADEELEGCIRWRPFCIFPSIDGDCFMKHRDPQHGCLNCSLAESDYLAQHAEVSNYIGRINNLIQEMIMVCDHRRLRIGWYNISEEYLTYYNHIRESFGLRKLDLSELLKKGEFKAVCDKSVMSEDA